MAKSALKDLGKSVAKVASDKPHKTKQKNKAVENALKLKRPETYYYSVSGKPLNRDY